MPAKKTIVEQIRKDIQDSKLDLKKVNERAPEGYFGGYHRTP